MADVDDDAQLEKDFSDLQEVQSKIEEMNSELEVKMIELDKQYTKKKRPLYEKRASVCSRIPNFWMNCLVNHPGLGSCISLKDLDCLRNLSSVDVEEIDEDGFSGTKYTFSFTKNDFFDNSEIVKEFKYDTKSGEAQVHSTTIDWKPGMNPTIFEEAEANGTGKRDEPEGSGHSFFSWFDADEESEKPYGDWLTEDIFKDPFKYFCGDVEEGEEGEEDEEDDGEDDGEDEEGDEEGDEEEDGEGEEEEGDE